MTKLSDMVKVNMLLTKRERLIEQRERVARATNEDHALGVTIQGQYQDWDMLKIVQPVVLVVLVERIYDIDNQLTTLGVEVTE